MMIIIIVINYRSLHDHMHLLAIVFCSNRVFVFFFFVFYLLYILIFVFLLHRSSLERLIPVYSRYMIVSQKCIVRMCHD